MVDTDSTSTIVLPIFGGQGVLSFDPQGASKRLGLYTSFPSGAVLFTACYDAFHTELRSLSSDLTEKVGICANDFKEKGSILSPIHEQYLLNPVVSGTALLLQQALQYLLFVEKSDSETKDRTLEEIFHLNSQHTVGILGFSSGILAAAVVATSRTELDFIKHAVEAYRLAFWIGVRVQLFLHSSTRHDQISNSNSWALAIVSNDKSDIEQSVLVFNKASSRSESRVYITAVIDDNCVTVSGHPDDLAAFKPLLSDTAVVCETNIVGLYHVPSRLDTVREEVLSDVASRGIRFPTLEHMFVPLSCSSAGELLGSSSTGSLIARVVDMVLIHPVNWNEVVKSASASIPVGCPVQILNFGGGKGLVKSLTKSLKGHGISNFQCVEMGGEGKLQAATRHEPIAIVGMAVNVPGAKTVDELWDVLKGGLKTLQPIPLDRFDSSVYTTGQIPGRSMNVDTGNFLQDVWGFDNKFFGINPREAKSMDPQQRILLHVAYEALEDAGYTPDSTPTFSRDTFGCYIGAATHDYVHNLRESIDVYYATGTLGAFLSGRLSYCLGLGGPSLVIDTACSSSIVAIHQACRALLNGDCSAALAGGVNVISSPDMFIGLDKAHFLSSTGCKSFDASADGYSRAEGCGIFVLKRLSDAVSENDRILGLIRGVEVNQSGLAHSITHPHGPTQESLLKRVLERSDMDPRLINYVESHGTGTQAGDVNEIQSLRRILAVDRSSNNPLYIGSIKSNIGHLEAASGSAGLAKVLLMLRHGMIPAQVSLRHLNPKIPCLDIDNTVISTENIPWLAAVEGLRRFALINNFGAAGSNAAMIIEEYIPASTKQPPSNVSSYVFALSAKDNVAVENMRANLVGWLQQQRKETCLANLSYTLMARKQVYPYRLVVTAATMEELISRLGHATPVQAYQHDPPVVFAFSGLGSQYRGMGSALYLSCSLFRKCIDECDSILRAAKFGSILPIIVGVGLGDDNKTDYRTGEVDQTAIFSLEYALAMLWISWGVKPTAVVGHSLGEYAALVIAGVFSLSDALILVAKRSALVFEKCVHHSTGMLAVALEPEKLRSILESPRGSNLNISCYNSPQACVISGPIGELVTLKEFLESTFACRCTQLDVPFAYHSPAMAPVLGDLAAIGSQVKARPPSIPVLSSVFGRVIMPGDGSFCNSDYVAKHCAYPVRFVDSIGAYVSYPNLHTPETTWIEIGPHASLLPMLKSFPPLFKSNIITSLHKRHDNWTAMSKALSSLYLTHSIDWRVLFSQIGHVDLLSLPKYPFSPAKYWITYKEHTATSATGFSLIQNLEQYPSSSNMGVAIFQTSASHLAPYISGHRVAGVPLCPASVFIELVAAGTILALKRLSRYLPDSAIVFTDFTFVKPFTTNSGRSESPINLRISVDTLGGVFSVGSCTPSRDETIHAKGQYKLLEKAETLCELEVLIPLIESRITDIVNVPSDGRGPEKFSTRTIYDHLFARVVGYSQEFQTIQSLILSSDGREAIANVRIDVGFQLETFVVNILLADTMLHVPGLVSNLQGSQTHAYICSEIGSLAVLPGCVDRRYSCTVYCKISKLSDGMLCQSYAFREGQPRVLIAVAKEIRFQRVNLAGLKRSLRNSTGFPTESPSLDLDNIRSTVIGIVRQACDLDTRDISLEVDFASLGMDSLGCVELYHDLTSAFPNMDIHPEDISKCKNIQAIIELISGPSTTPTTPPARTNPPTSFSALSLASSAFQIKQIFAQVLELDEDSINEDMDLGSLGLDSLSCIEAIHLLATRYGAHLPANFVNSSTTIRDVRNHLSSSGALRDDGFNHATNTSTVGAKNLPGVLILRKQPWCLQKAVSSPHTPLILIHDGSGLAACYRHISNIHRDLYGINNPYFSSSQVWWSITELATTYAESIQKEFDGPVLVGGWSFGGVVAFEVARILRARSLDVKGVVLIDTPSPLIRVELNTDVIDYVLSNTNSVEAEFRERCRLQLSMSSRLLNEYKPVSESGLVIPVVFLRSMDGFNPLNLADVPAWLSNRADPKSTVFGWDALSGSDSIRVIDIPGNHFQPFESKNGN